MTRLFRFRPKPAGLSPGTLVHTGPAVDEAVRITVITYTADHIEEHEVSTIQDCLAHLGENAVTWINIDGVHRIDIIEQLGKHLGLHPLVLEDVVHTEQRPKTEDYGDYIYMVLRMLQLTAGTTGIQSEQISLLLGPRWVLTFQERQGDIFDPVRRRLRNGKGRVRREGADYLGYCLLDTVVDSYFGILEHLGEQLEPLEEQILAGPDGHLAHHLHHLKRESITIRRAVWPLREVVAALERGDSRLIRKGTRTFLRDVYDHAIHVIDTIELLRDMLSGMHDLYLNSVSHRMNEVMKMLTIIATIFIPLTFIAGVYGMNFVHMPELGWRYSYFIVLAAMAALTLGMIAFFKRKGWL